MKKSHGLTLILLAALAQGGLSASELIDASAGTAFPAAEQGASARAIGMGSTYVGIAEGSASLAWNPAGLAGLCGTEVALHHNSTVIGAFEETLALGMPLGESAGFGASVTYGDSGDFTGRDALGVPNGDYNARAYGASVGVGFRILPDISLGAALKADRQDLAGVSFNAVAADLGAVWAPTRSLSVGAAYKNLGPDVAGYHLGQGLSLGISSYLWKGSDLQWLLSLSGEALTFADNGLHLGLEGTFYQMVSLRAGYGRDLPQGSAADGMRGWTLGAGVMVAGLALDYAFVPLGDIGNVQRISLTYAFGGCKGPSSDSLR